MRYPLYAYNVAGPESGNRLVYTLARQLPAAVPAISMIGEQIGYATVPHNLRKVGRVDVPDEYVSRIDGDRVIIDERGAYTAPDLVGLFGVHVRSSGMHWCNYPRKSCA